MDSFFGILIVAVFYLIAIISGNKKKKARQSKQKAPNRGTAAWDQAFDDVSTELEKVLRNMSAQPDAPRMNQNVHAQEDCAASRVHLHEVTPRQMAMAGEGEDPCHAGGASMRKAESEFSYDDDQAQRSDFAEDVLRGVIMSEILTRPCERAVRNRRGG